MVVSKIVAIVIAAVCITTCHALDHNESRTEVFSWLSSQPGFYFNDKLSFRHGNIVVKDTVQANEVLMIIPESAVLSIGDEQEEEGKFCQLYNVLSKEVNLKEASQYAPYLQQIQTEQALQQSLPSLWSNTGQRLLEIVSLTRPSDKISSVLEDHYHCMEDDRDDKEQEHDTLMLSAKKDPKSEFGVYKGIKHKNRARSVSSEDLVEDFLLALAVKHQMDESYLVPLYDQLTHHQLKYNSKHTILKDGSVEVTATRSIAAGESLSRPSMGCLEDCGQEFEHANFVEVFKNFGEVQPYPHYWKFETGMSFIYHGAGKIEWIQKPNKEVFDLLKDEVLYQQKAYHAEVVPSRDTVHPREWIAIHMYAKAVISMLQDVVGQQAELFGDSEDDSDDSEDDSDDEEDNEEIKDVVETTVKESKRTDDWAVNGCDLSENCAIMDIWASRNCGTVDEHHAVRNETEWVLMRSAYVAVVGPSHASIPLTFGSGVKVPYKVGHSPGRGRGVFATEDVPKGTLVWTQEYTAKFIDGIRFRKFLSVLPDDMVCDMVLWCYTYKGNETDADGNEIQMDVIGCDMDEGKLPPADRQRNECTY